MTLEEAKALTVGDRLRWAKDGRLNHWREVLKTHERGVEVTHFEAGRDVGHHELFDWEWLTQIDYPYHKI